MGERDDWTTLRDYQKGLSREGVRLVNSGVDALLKADMGLGKTYFAGHIAQWQSKPVTVYTRQWSTRHDIRDYALSDDCPDLDETDIVVAPTLQRHCDSFDSREHSKLTRIIKAFQYQGATVSDIHERLGDSMPCQQDGRCTYTERASFVAEDKKLIIASPQHAYIGSYNQDRVAIIDENSGGAYETELTDEEVRTAITEYLKHDGEINAETLDDLQRMNPREQVAVMDHLESKDLIDSKLGLSRNGQRADSRLLILGHLKAQTMPVSKFKRAELDVDGLTAVVLADEKEGGVTIRVPPKLYLADCVLALDGTPHVEMTENRLGRRLDVVNFLSEEERQTYIRDILGYHVYQTTDQVQPYSSGEYVSERHMLALLEAVWRRHGDGTLHGGEPVPFITSKKAKDKIREFAPRQYNTFVSNDELHFGKIRSQSVLEGENRLIIGGSRHPGDREIQRLAALDGHDIPEGKGRGNDKTYGEVGDTYYQHVTHNMTAQSIFRVGRTDEMDEAHIYVHTSTIPDWIPVEYISKDRIRSRTDNEHMTIRALQKLEVATTAEVSELVEHCDRTVRQHLNNLAAEGYVEKNAERGKIEWVDAGLDNMDWWGEVDLPN